MPSCPKCGAENATSAREWIGGAKTSKAMKVKRFVCSSYGTSNVAWTDSKTEKLKVMTREK